MPFPSTLEFALKASNTITSSDYLNPQPHEYRMKWAPRRKRADGGLIQDGLDAVELHWKGMTQSEYAVLTGHWQTSLAAAGFYYVRYWDESASSGAGGFTTAKCVLHQPTFSRVYYQNYYDVVLLCDALGVA